MQSVRRSLVLVSWLFVLASLVCVPVLVAAAEEVEITGTLYAVEWDNSNNASAVIIVTIGGEEIVVSKSGKGDELLKLVSHNVFVKATGTVATNENGSRIIKVTKYSIIQ